MASANSTRCFCPPERSPNLRSFNFSSPAAARTSAACHGLLVIAGEQIDVLADAQGFRNTPHLQHGAGAHPVFRIRRVAAEDSNFSRVRLAQSEQQFHGRGFARPVRPEQRDDFAGMHAEIHVAQRAESP